MTKELRYRVVNFVETPHKYEESKELSKNIRMKVIKFEQEAIPTRDAVTQSNNHADQPINKINTCRDVKKSITLKSKSELFRCCRSNSLARGLSSKRWSFDDIREKLKDNICGTKRHNVHRKTLDNNFNRKRNYRSYRSLDKRQDDVKVLYTSERFKGQNNKGDHATSISKNTLIKKSPNYSTQYRNTYLCYQTCRNTGLFPTPKRKIAIKKSDSKSYNLHTVYPLRIASSSKSKVQRFSKKSNLIGHYNLVGFPVYNNAKKKLSRQLLCKAASPVLQTVADCRCDTDDVRNTLIKSIAPETCSLPVKNLENQNYSIENTNQSGPMETIIYIFRSVVMLCLLLLIIVVWLPCIIIGVISWFIISLLRPENMIIDQDGDEKVDDFRYNKCKCKMYRWITHNAQRFSMLMRNLISKEYVCTAPRPQFHQMPIHMPCQVMGMRRRNMSKGQGKWQPNPTKKYVLYYTGQRGWLMKPVRNQICNNYDNFSHCCGVTKPIKKDRSVTFWDSQDRDECKCDHRPEDRMTDECTQVTCRNPKTKLPTCNICPEEMFIPSNFKSKPLIRPCPTSRPCPSRMRKQQLRLQQVVNRREATKRHSVNVLSQQRDPVIRSHEMRSYRKFEEKEMTENIGTGKKIWRFFKRRASDMKNGFNSAEEAWGEGIECGGNMYLNTLKKRPCFWIYRRWPSLYPLFLAWLKMCSNVCHGFMFICAACVWCPLFFCCYLCFNLICMSCGGGC